MTDKRDHSSPLLLAGTGRKNTRAARQSSLLDTVWHKVMPELVATRVAWLMLFVVTLLCTISLMAVRICGRGLVLRQEIHILIGMAVLLLLLIVNYRKLGYFAYPFFIFTTLLLVAVRFAPPIKGSHRWFILPGDIDLQPSELAKISFVMAVAWCLRSHKDMRQLNKLIMPFIFALIPMGLILIEPDLGTALLFPVVLYAMLIAAGAKFRHLLAIVLIAMAVAPGCYPLLRPYQKQRIVALFVHGKPTHRQLSGELYQKRQSEIAEGSGGLTGQGLQGTVAIRHGLLPEASNDFIFAVVGSQWGFAGAVVILVLYLIFFAASMETAGESADSFGRLLVVGLSSMLMLQAAINIAMTTGIIPVVGITLPFMSYGGSAMLADMLAMSLILNVAMRGGRIPPGSGHRPAARG
ncbi:MAG: FtsW/RodA/SpoVE family cell cycle protein [Phycisphaerae bacterium]